MHTATHPETAASSINTTNQIKSAVFEPVAKYIELCDGLKERVYET